MTTIAQEVSNGLTVMRRWILLSEPMSLVRLLESVAVILLPLGFGFGVAFSHLCRSDHKRTAICQTSAILWPAKAEALRWLEGASDQEMTWGARRRIRNVRATLLGRYLREMVRDFRRTCAALNLLMVESLIDRPDLARTVLTQQLVFLAAMLRVHARLTLYACGLGLGYLDLSPVRLALAGLHQTLLPFTATARAT
jgi:hypothetical protein